MKILAFDTALDACSAALVEMSSGQAATLAAAFRPMTRGHAEALMPLVRGVMAEARMGFDDIDRIAVTVGPGTFTGVRIGIAAARGIALAASKPAVGVTSLEAVAANVVEAGLDMDAHPIAAVFDASRGEVYMQIFGPDLEPGSEPQVLAVPDAVALVAHSGAILVGSGASILAEAAGAGAWLQLAPASVSPLPDAAVVARLAAAKPVPEVPPLPLYLRPPDAKPQVPFLEGSVRR